MCKHNNVSAFIDNSESVGFPPSLNKYFSRYVIVFGLISIILGVIILIKPFTTVAATAYFFGFVLIVVGIGQFVYAFNGHSSVLWRIIYAITGILSIILGLSALTNPDPGYAIDLLATYLGVVWLLRGFTSLFLAFSIKDIGIEILNILIGIIGIIGGIAILGSPLFASLTITFLVTYAGVILVITGIAEIIGALTKR